MFFGEYDYDLDMQVKAEEARERGLAEGHAEGLLKGQQQKAIEAALTLIKEYNETPEVAAQKMKAPLDKVLEAYNSVSASL